MFDNQFNFMRVLSSVGLAKQTKDHFLISALRMVGFGVRITSLADLSSDSAFATNLVSLNKLGPG